jgi:outer membrane protein
MQPTHLNDALSFGFTVALACAAANAYADDTENTIKVGYAHIGFHTESGNLSGPIGTTPPGIQTDLKDARTLALVYERHLQGPWSIVIQTGAPPVVKMVGAGSGAALGDVGTARAWFPAVLTHYTFTGPWGTQPYVGAGLNYTFYTGGRVSSAYTDAFNGTTSTAKLKSSWGHVLKIGIAFPLGQDWVLDAAYSRYGIRTTATIVTATSGFGEITRRINVRSDPGVMGLMLGYKF